MESFDKKIREKLEQIPDANPGMAWVSFAKSLPKPWYMTFLKNYAGWSFATIVTAVLISQQITIDKLEQKLANKTTQNETISLEKTPNPNPQNIPSEIKTQPESNLSLAENQTNNTAIDDDQIKQTNDNLRENAPLKNIQTFDNKSIIYGKYKKESSTEIGHKSISEVNLKKQKTRKSENQKSESELKFNSELENIKIESERNVAKIKEAVKTSDSDLSTDNFKSSNNEKQKIGSEPVSKPVNNSVNNTIAEVQNQVSESQKESTQVSDMSNVKNTDETLNLVSEPKDESATIEKIPEKQASIDPLGPNNAKSDFKPKLVKSKKINLKLGIETQLLSNGKAGLGPIAEYLFGTHFSVSTGVIFSSNHKDEFKQPQEFNKRTGKRFEDYYRPYLGDKQREIKNIEIRTSAVVIPLKVNYYYPLKYNFNVFGTVGAAFKIYEKDEVIFEGKAPLEDAITSTFENKRDSKPISNFSYGIGLQYTYKKRALQIQPNFNFPTQKSFFLNERNRIGLDASLRFSLGK